MIAVKGFDPKYGESYELVSDTDDQDQASTKLGTYLGSTATIDYMVKVLEWWYGTNDPEFTISNGPNGHDVWVRS